MRFSGRLCHEELFHWNLTPTVTLVSPSRILSLVDRVGAPQVSLSRIWRSEVVVRVHHQFLQF